MLLLPGDILVSSATDDCHSTVVFFPFLHSKFYPDFLQQVTGSRAGHAVRGAVAHCCALSPQLTEINLFFLQLNSFCGFTSVNSYFLGQQITISTLKKGSVPIYAFCSLPGRKFTQEVFVRPQNLPEMPWKDPLHY